MDVLLQQVSNASATTPWDALAAIGGAGIAGLMFAWLQNEIRNHKDDYRKILERQEKLSDKFLEVQIKQLEALGELTNAVQQMNDINRLEKKIEELTYGRSQDPKTS